MRKVLIAGVVLSALIVACETKSPSGPEGLAPTTSTTTTSVPAPPTPTTTTSSTTTSLSIRNIALAFGVVNPPPNIPSQMNLFARLITGVSAPTLAFSSTGGPNTQSEPENEYEITGVYVMLNGTTGTVNGVLGGTLDPLQTGGVFIGRLTARTPSGCTAEREFSGTLSLLSLQWTGGAPGTSTCQPSPLAMASLSMLRTTADAPLPQPPVTTSSISTTTTTVACTYSLSPTTASFDSSGGTGSVTVTAPAGCGWSAQSFADWITILPPHGQAGSGTVSYQVAATTTERLNGRLLIAGQNFFVNQSAPPADLMPMTISCSAAGAGQAQTVTVTVRNAGPGAAGPSTTRIDFIGSEDPTDPADQRINTTMAAGTSQNVMATIPGDCYSGINTTTESCTLIITADVNGEVTETSDVNNVTKGACTRPLPPPVPSPGIR